MIWRSKSHAHRFSIPGPSREKRVAIPIRCPSFFNNSKNPFSVKRSTHISSYTWNVSMDSIQLFNVGFAVEKNGTGTSPSLSNSVFSSHYHSTNDLCTSTIYSPLTLHNLSNWVWRYPPSRAPQLLLKLKGLTVCQMPVPPSSVNDLIF